MTQLLLPHAVDRRQRARLFTMAACVRAIQTAHARLVDEMVKPEFAAMPLMLDAWALVDWANRLRILVPGVPGLKKRAPAVQLLLRALEPVEAARDRIQHLDQGLADDLVTAEQAPVLGMLQWTHLEGGRARTVVTAAVMVPGAGGARVVPVDLPRDHGGTLVREPIDRIRLLPSREGVALGLSSMVDAVESFDRALRVAVERAKRAQEDDLINGAGVVLALRPEPVPDPGRPPERRIRVRAVEGLEANVEGYLVRVGRTGFAREPTQKEKDPR